MRSSSLQAFVFLLVSLGIASTEGQLVAGGLAGNQHEPAGVHPELVCVLRSKGGYALTAVGDVRERFSKANVIVFDLSLVDRGKPTSGTLPDDLTQEDGIFWPHHRIQCGEKKLTLTKVDPVRLPGRREITWLDYKRREITLKGARRVITPERIVFRRPRLSPNDVEAIRATYRRLKEQGEPRDMNDIETLLGQVFLWALQDSEHERAALRDFRDTFQPDGVYGEADSNYREMYEAITGRRL